MNGNDFNGGMQQPGSFQGSHMNGNGYNNMGPRRGRGGRDGRGGNGPYDRNQFQQQFDSSQSPFPSSNPSQSITATLGAQVSSPTPVSAPPARNSNGVEYPERPGTPTLCKFALACTNPVCRYSHPSPAATVESGLVLSNEACEKGVKCDDKDCTKGHPSKAILDPNGAFSRRLIPMTHSNYVLFLLVSCYSCFCCPHQIFL